MREIPKWLKDLAAQKKAAFYTQKAQILKQTLDDNFCTVCKEAKCPNRGECFCSGEATIMILGSICTRSCRFCSVPKHQIPKAPDPQEPTKIASFVKQRNLKYLVLTMPTRDDLKDGGATHIAAVLKEVKKQNPACLIEPLISDLKGDMEALRIVLSAKPEVLGHNMETVPSLYSKVRIGASYERSLNLLKQAKEINPNILTKSSLMLGLGETKEELKQVFKDLRHVNCDILTLGQYLAPSAEHLEVQSYPTQDYYDELKDFCLSLGFKGVLAGPFVRSSYKAGSLYKEAIKKAC
jgi:lipoate synthase